MAELWRNDAFRFYLMLAGCVGLMYLPVVGRYLRMLATMVHEGGHVIVARKNTSSMNEMSAVDVVFSRGTFLRGRLNMTCFLSCYLSVLILSSSLPMLRRGWQ